MQEKINAMLCDPVGTSSRQASINDNEWRKPENWHGRLFPSYSSKIDTRPFVPGRMFRPRTNDDLRGVGFLTSQVVNRGHTRGRVWSIIGWVAVAGIVIVWVVAAIISGT